MTVNGQCMALVPHTETNDLYRYRSWHMKKQSLVHAPNQQDLPHLKEGEWPMLSKIQSEYLKVKHVSKKLPILSCKEVLRGNLKSLFYLDNDVSQQ